MVSTEFEEDTVLGVQVFREDLGVCCFLLETSLLLPLLPVAQLGQEAALPEAPLWACAAGARNIYPAQTALPYCF